MKVDERCRDLENALNHEMSVCGNLRKQLKQFQLTADDKEWQLEEQLAHVSSLIVQERGLNNDLREKLAASESKLVEVEMYLASERGSVTLQLEQELAVCKLKIAELEAEKDELNFELKRRRANAIKDRTNDRSSKFATEDSNYQSI